MVSMDTFRDSFQRGILGARGTFMNTSLMLILGLLVSIAGANSVFAQSARLTAVRAPIAGVGNVVTPAPLNAEKSKVVTHSWDHGQQGPSIANGDKPRIVRLDWDFGPSQAPK